MPDPCCSIGARPDVAEIDAALRASVTPGASEGLGAIMRRFPGAAKASLSRHRSRCLALPPKPPDPPPEALAPKAAALVEGAVRNGFQAGSSSGDGDGGLGEDVAEITAGYARATRSRPIEAAKCANSFEARVQFVAMLVSQGRYIGRPTAVVLGRAWGVEHGTVQDYYRAATALTAKDLGELEDQRQLALGQWSSIREIAIEEGDLRSAVAAQAGHDRASGVVTAAGTQVQVNVSQVNGVPELTRGTAAVVMALLRRFAPENAAAAGAAYQAWLRATLDGDQAATRDPAAWVLAQVGVIDVPALPGGGSR